MTSQGILKRKVKDLLITKGSYWFVTNDSDNIKQGVPDIIACYRGVFIAIETKSGNEQPTQLQQKILADIIKAGGVAIVINDFNLKDLNEVFEKLDLLPDQNVAGFGWTVAPT